MNWKSEAVEKLRQYEAKKNALQSIPEEIERLESAMVSIRSSTSDGTPVAGGGSRREEMLLNNIVLREELARALEQAKKWVATVASGLEVLSAEERLILDRCFINPEKGSVERLAEELGVDVKTAYRRRYDALHHFTVCLYGVTES